MEYPDVMLDENGLNADVFAIPLEDERMRELGFTDHSAERWYFCRRVGNGITFNLTIPKNGTRLQIDVLDEDFGQPYDYQSILRNNPKFEFAINVRDNVEKTMKELSTPGVEIIQGWEPGMYL